MIIKLARVSIQLTSPHTALKAQWHDLFAPVELSAQKPAVEIKFDVASEPAAWQRVGDLSLITQNAPIFEDGSAKLSVFGLKNGRFLLHFHDGAILKLCLKTMTIHGQLHERLVANGRLEDLTYTALAPLLRRCGCYLVHAFGVKKSRRTVLFVGPPHSGKTTAGLSLVERGWQLLGNDIILLTHETDGIVAWPTPGHIGVRAATFDVLGISASRQWDHRQWLENGRLPPASPITDLIFPHVKARAPTKLSPLTTAEALGRLMSASMDRWDAGMIPAHVALLKQLCVQTAVFTLQSGVDIQHLHTLL